MREENQFQKHTRNRWIWLLCLALLSGLFLVGVTQRGVLLLPDGRRGVFPLTEDKAKLQETPEGGWRILPRDEALFSYMESLQFGLQAEEGGPISITYDVKRQKRDGTFVRESGTDKNPAFVGTEVLRLRAKDVREITIQPGVGTKAIRITDLRVDNGFHWNPYVFVFGFCAGLSLFGLLFWRSYFARRPAGTFLLLALTLGTAMACALPRNKVGADEETHLQAVMDLASLPKGEMHFSDELMYQLMVSAYNDPEAQPANQAEQAELDRSLAERVDYRTGRQEPEFVTLSNRVPAYFTMAAAVKLGQKLQLPWPKLLLAARLANLLTYVCLMALAIRLAPFGKHLLLVIGLFPQSLFLAVTVSYDPFVIGLLCLGMAALFRLLCGAQQTRKAAMFSFALLCLFMGCLPKAVYAPLLLIGLAVPAASGKSVAAEQKVASAQSSASVPLSAPGQAFAQLRLRKLLLRLLPLCLFALLILSFILPTALAPAETGDLRGGATSEASQVGYILAHPFGYALLLLWQMLRWIPQCFFWADCTSFMGHLVNGSTAFHGYAGFYALLLAASILPFLWCLQGRRKIRLADGGGKAASQIEGTAAAGFQKLWCFLMVGACAVLIWTSMYVAFTEPGAAEIAGVQGRYFLPLLYPLYAILFRWSPPAAVRKAAAAADVEKLPPKECFHGGEQDLCLVGKGALWYDFTIRLLLWAGLALTIWRVVIAAFCL